MKAMVRVNAMLRACLVALLGVLLALPAMGGSGGGGGNTGEGIGVWILPRSSSLPSLVPVFIDPPRAQMHFCTLSQPIVMKVSSEVVNPFAALIDPITNQAIALQVNGSLVTIPVSVLSGLASAGVTVAPGTIVDANNRGYYFQLLINLANSSADVLIY